LRRQLARGFLGFLFLAALLGFGEAPAKAANDACVFSGTMTLSPTGLGTFPTHGPNTSNFTFSGIAVCAIKTTLSATGTVTGWCADFVGQGTTNNGHPFSVTSKGATLVLSGTAYGAFTVVDDPTDTGSCTNKTAKQFLVSGVLAKYTPCGVLTSETTVPHPLSPGNNLVWVRVCV